VIRLDGFKVSSWVDIKKLKEVFGIKVKYQGKWINAADNGGAVFFDSKEKAQQKIKEMKAQQPAEKESSLLTDTHFSDTNS
jgi:hypothetical protein